MVDVNAVRGEVALTLAGVEYPLRPTYEAVTAFERLAGMGQYQLADAANANALGVEVLAIVVAELIRAHAKAHDDSDLIKVRAERIGQLIYETGTVLVSKTLAALLLRAAMGGYSATGEAKAVEVMTGTPSAA